MHLFIYKKYYIWILLLLNDLKILKNMLYWEITFLEKVLVLIIDLFWFFLIVRCRIN